MPLTVLVLLMVISLLFAKLLLQPLAWFGSISLPAWVGLAIALVLVSWCLGE
ncbi:MAG: hypothetical protein K6T90_05300 [Leptolyngbyaceae cyanobacterium HOT.MB2.61]|nr:hypothetical protein [Leptolyngbyaceae cyanobacterium HOT.MB2.61]